MASEGGQATVEFLIVAVAFLAITLGLAAIAAYLSDGALVREAVDNAANTIGLVGKAARRILIY